MLTLLDHPDKWYKAVPGDFIALRGSVPGFFPVDKPPGVTSRRVTDALRKKVGAGKAGHTGTLDPFATGVLVVAVDAALKVIKYSRDWDKVYEGTVLLGFHTDTYDMTGRILERSAVVDVSREAVEGALAGFVGEITQGTPPVSAARVGGRRLYEHARNNRRLSPPRVVTVHSLEITGWNPPRLKIRVRCGSGTYIRSIAHEMGQVLGTGAALEELKRVREGPFCIEDCFKLEDM
ncbi:MAG: tRNA pseudouridine(55) synthase TruB [Planctomycetes bacterium]|nr:tRNA pseudouridine(55) synthase TruB [Planctomycetota bacterium]